MSEQRTATATIIAFPPARPTPKLGPTEDGQERLKRALAGLDSAIADVGANSDGAETDGSLEGGDQ